MVIHLCIFAEAYYYYEFDVRSLLGVSLATAIRILSGFVKEGRLGKVHSGRYWGYELDI